jgi:membrane protein implicated in regulation of membrane protease activity
MAKGKKMEDTSGPGQRGLLALLSIVTLIVVLIIVSGSPERFLNWFLSLLAALTILLLFVFVFALVLVVIAAILRRYIEKRRQAFDDELHDQQSDVRRTQYIRRRQQNHRAPEE